MKRRLVFVRVNSHSIRPDPEGNFKLTLLSSLYFLEIPNWPNRSLLVLSLENSVHYFCLHFNELTKICLEILWKTTFVHNNIKKLHQRKFFVKLTNYNHNSIFELQGNVLRNTRKNFQLTFFDKLKFVKNDKLAKLLVLCIEIADFLKSWPFIDSINIFLENKQPGAGPPIISLSPNHLRVSNPLLDFRLRRKREGVTMD